MKKLFVCFAVMTAMFLMVGCQNKSQANSESQTGNESKVKKEAKIELEWSSVSDRKMKWNQAVRYCKNLVEDGHDDWRLPSVDEFRTTISPEYFPWYAVGGICPLSDKNNCLSLSCWKDIEFCSIASLAFGVAYSAIRIATPYFKEALGTEWWKADKEKIDEYKEKHPEMMKKMEEKMQSELLKVQLLIDSGPTLWTSSPISDETTSRWVLGPSGFMFAKALDEEGLIKIDSQYNHAKCVRGKLPENIIITKRDGLGADFINEMIKNNNRDSKTSTQNPTTTSPQTETKAKKDSAEPTKIGDLTWSSTADKEMDWNDGLAYCKNLNEGGYSDWHLPTISELRTLIQNCPATETGGECGITDGCLSWEKCWNDACDGCDHDYSGKYSKLGNSYWLWSSSIFSDDIYYAWDVFFHTGSIYRDLKTRKGHVRCVRGSQTETKVKKESSETTKIGNLLWSSNASDKMNWNSAVKYCKNLNEGGYSNWRLPNIDELRTLIQNCSGTESGGACQASEKNDCLSSECWTSEDCTSCAGDSSKEYSKLGDTDWYWSSSTFSDNTESAFGVNFDNGIVGKQLRKTHYYKVRCVK